MSGRPCSACADPRRPELDEALVRGDSLRDIAGRFGTSKSALARHRPHVQKALVKAAERKDEHREETLLGKVERLEADARRLGEKAEADGDFRCAIAAVKELLDVVKLLHELKPPSPTPGEWRDLFERFETMSDGELDDELVRRGCPRAVLARLGTRLTVQHVSVPLPVDTAPPSEPEPEESVAVLPTVKEWTL